MKTLQKVLLLSLIVFGFIIAESCANARVRANVGVGVDFGPHGPRVTPTFDVGIYNGGRL